MVQPFLPGATFIDLGPDGGPYDELAHPKGCIHTTEGSSLASAEAAFASYPPHIGYDPNTRTIHQYIRFDRHSLAFKGAESDDEFVVQVEIVGFANATHTWSDQVYRNIGVDVIEPLRRIFGIPNNYLRFYGEGEGIILASPDSPIRLSSSAFRDYRGWLGHQHVPAPDAHWDPGRFNMDLALTYSLTGESDMTPEEHEWLRQNNAVIGVAFDGSSGQNLGSRVVEVDNRTTAMEQTLATVMTKLADLTEKVDALAISVEGTTLTPVVDGEIRVSYVPKPEA